MSLLLDTHAFIWYSIAPERLSESVSSALNDKSSVVFVSQVSVWEMQIKSIIGKLRLPVSVRELVHSNLEQNDFNLLKIENDHLWNLEQLPNHHKDPFDRLLISQARYEDLSLVTRDGKISQYDVKTLW